MRLNRMYVALVLAAVLAALQACGGENQSEPQSASQTAIVKGGDDRTGELSVYSSRCSSLSVSMTPQWSSQNFANTVWKLSSV